MLGCDVIEMWLGRWWYWIYWWCVVFSLVVWRCSLVDFVDVLLIVSYVWLLCICGFVVFRCWMCWFVWLGYNVVGIVLVESYWIGGFRWWGCCYSFCLDILGLFCGGFGGVMGYWRWIWIIVVVCWFVWCVFRIGRLSLVINCRILFKGEVLLVVVEFIWEFCCCCFIFGVVWWWSWSICWSDVFGG